jgi:hypothetical protein
MLLERLEKNEERMKSLREAVKELIINLHKANIGASSSTRANVGLFETDEEAEGKRLKSKELGQLVVRLAADCSKKSSFIETLPKDLKIKEILGKEGSVVFFKSFGLSDSTDNNNNNNNNLENNNNNNNSQQQQQSITNAQLTRQESVDINGTNNNNSSSIINNNNNNNPNTVDIEDLEGNLMNLLQQWLKHLTS